MEVPATQIAVVHAEMGRVGGKPQTLLALAQGLLRPLLLGHITPGAEPFDDFTLRIEQWNRTRQHPAPAAVCAPDPMLHLEKTLGPDGFPDGRHQLWLIIPINVILKPVAIWFFRFDDEVLVINLAHLTPVRTHATHQIRARQHQRAEAPLALAQRIFGLLAFGDVADDRRCADDVSVGILQR